MHGLSIRFHSETHHPSRRQGLHGLGPASAVSCHLPSDAKFISLAGGRGNSGVLEHGLNGEGSHFLASSKVVLPLLEGTGPGGKEGTDLHRWDQLQWGQMTPGRGLGWKGTRE